MKRVVLDTNIVISAFLWGGTPGRVITAAVENGITLLRTEAIVREIEQTLNKPKFDSQFQIMGKTRAQLVQQYMQLTSEVIPSPVPTGIIRDEKDEVILAAAVGGKADVIVTGDKDLTDINTFQQVRILTPAQFLAALEPPPAE